jgi:hypothetical protein
MKKLIALSLIVFSLYSCQEKLPSNISSSSSWLKMKKEQFEENMIIPVSNLSKEKIDNMPTDSINSLLSWIEYQEKDIRKLEDELDDLLKYNAKFSDYEEIKESRHFDIRDDATIKRSTKYRNIKNYIQNLSYYRLDQEFPKEHRTSEEPKWNPSETELHH